MNEQLAMKILGINIKNKDTGLYKDTCRELDDFLYWDNDYSEIILDGRFTLEQLEAITWWMKNKAINND